MPNSITICMTRGGIVNIYVNEQLSDTISASHRCWSKYIGEYEGMIRPGSTIKLEAIPDEGMQFDKYQIFNYPIPPGEIMNVYQNPYVFTVYDKEVEIQVYFKEIPKPTATIHVNKAISYSISGHVMRFYKPVVHLLMPDGTEIVSFTPKINAEGKFGFRIYVDNKVCVSGSSYTTCGEKVMAKNQDVTVEFSTEEAFNQPYLLYKVSRGSQIFKCTTDKYSGSENSFSGYLITPDGRQIPIYSKPPTKTVTIKINVKSVGTPPLTVSAMVDGSKIGEIMVDAPGIYEIGSITLGPGIYIVNAVATDSKGNIAKDQKEFQI